MKRSAQALLILGILLLTAGCSRPDLAGNVVPPPGLASPAAATPLEEYRRAILDLKQQQRDNETLRHDLAHSHQEVAELYDRLAQEQKLRRESELESEALKADMANADSSKQIVDTLRGQLDKAKADLAAADSEIKARREELMKIILEQQKWNKYVLERIKTHE